MKSLAWRGLEIASTAPRPPNRLRARLSDRFVGRVCGILGPVASRLALVVLSLGLRLLFERLIDGQHRRWAEEAAPIRDRMERIRRSTASRIGQPHKRMS